MWKIALWATPYASDMYRGLHTLGQEGTGDGDKYFLCSIWCCRMLTVPSMLWSVVVEKTLSST